MTLTHHNRVRCSERICRRERRWTEPLMTPIGADGMPSGDWLESWDGEIIDRCLFQSWRGSIMEVQTRNKQLRKSLASLIHLSTKDDPEAFALISAAMDMHGTLGHGFMEAAYHGDPERQLSRRFGNHYLRTSAESAVQNGNCSSNSRFATAWGRKIPSALLLACACAAHAK